MALLNLQNLTLAFGSAPLLDSVDLQVHEGEKIAILGRNGAGKSTMMKLINGDLDPDGGTIHREKGLRTSLLSQSVPVSLHGSLYDVIAGGVSTPEAFHHHMDSTEELKWRQQIGKTLSLLTLDPEGIFETLSAGMKRRVLLGRALVNEPDILLLDEPTNHLDIDSIIWLEDFLQRYPKTLIFVTHDRRFLSRISTRIIEIDRGKLFDWKCNYETFLARKEAWLEAEDAQNELFDKKLAREEAWIRKGIKARRTRNEGRVRALKKMREERAERRDLSGTVRMEIQKTGYSGKIVIEAENLSFGYGENPLIQDFSTTIQRGDKIGIIGPNGCGKSTLIKLLLGELAPDSGTVKTGTRIEKAYFDQLRNQLDESLSVRKNVADGSEIIEFNGGRKHIIGYLQDFLFTPDRADVPVSALSGGEKNRLLLAKLFTKPSNFLIMDEPTNDLDIETLELLEELLLDYQGTLLLVSHDRTFINNVVTGTFAFEGNGVVIENAGGFDEWLERKDRGRVPEAKPQKKPREKQVREKTKLTFKEKQELASLPSLLEEKEHRQREIFDILADPSFYQGQGEKVAELKVELSNLEEEVERLFARWEELERFEE
ncbi:MAG TPA: ATP-binding cassette domain-containing protein [Spirochaetota bacterium]|nr:ATP-binding cassette domain-containing protein [Spirochaetota bacterium]